ncbi:MAG: substrate-binding domain-containing protein [Acetobacteraceae bacterium]|nr:substrate-binding domain-containing protein [Acetobacteraceae bacterium]
MTVRAPAVASLRVMSTLGLLAALQELAPPYEGRSGVRIDAACAPTRTLLDRIAAGERADVAILVSEAIERLIADGVLITEGRADLAISHVGIAVRMGAAKPDISSVEAFRRTLLQTPSLAYSRAGASGIFFDQLIEQLGIAHEVRAKATVIPSGLTGELVAKGEALLAVQQISELMAVPGIEVVGPLPREIASITIFSGAIFSDSRQPEEAGRLLRFLASEEAAPVIAATGLEPVSN